MRTCTFQLPLGRERILAMLRTPIVNGSPRQVPALLRKSSNKLGASHGRCHKFDPCTAHHQILENPAFAPGFRFQATERSRRYNAPADSPDTAMHEVLANLH